MDESKSSSDSSLKGKQASDAPMPPVRRSREQTTARILDVAEDLFSRRDPQRVTVREIAEQAGVTHALVHQYVGTKEQILLAVIERGAPRRQQIMSEHPDLRELMPLLFDDIVSRRIHTRSVVRSAMDGIEYAPFEDRLKSGRMLIELASGAAASGHTRLHSPEAMDPRIVMAAATSLIYGWVVTQDWLVEICGLQDEDPAEVHRRIREIAAYVAELVFPPADEST